MAWEVRIDAQAKKQLRSISRTNAKRIFAFIRERLSVVDDSKSLGEKLKGRLGDIGAFELVVIGLSAS